MRLRRGIWPGVRMGIIGLGVLLCATPGWSQADSSKTGKPESETAASVETAEPRSDSVETAKPEVRDTFTFHSDGPRSDDEIREVVRRYQLALSLIFQRELKMNPALRGTIKIRLAIKPNGVVSSATVLENSVGSSKLAWTIQQACLKWQFKQQYGAGLHTLDLSLPFEAT